MRSARVGAGWWRVCWRWREWSTDLVVVGCICNRGDWSAVFELEKFLRFLRFLVAWCKLVIPGFWRRYVSTPVPHITRPLGNLVQLTVLRLPRPPEEAAVVTYVPIGPFRPRAGILGWRLFRARLLWSGRLRPGPGGVRHCSDIGGSHHSKCLARSRFG